MLRALAVVFVLLFHLEINLFKGGFLGVDIFFVISGYLISRNILQNLRDEQFSLKEFYFKRIRRLFPALVVTVFFTLIAAYFFLASANMPRLGKVAGCSLVSISNFFFLGEQGYFNGEGSLKPLLHTWSLGVEEQFYLFWPILLLLLHRLGQKMLLISIVFIGIMSLVFSQYYVSSHPNLVFYMLPFRLFEFMIGVLAVFLQVKFTKRDQAYLLIPLLGFITMVLSAVLLDSSNLMPGVYSLIPCLAVMTVLVFPLELSGQKLGVFKIFELLGKSSYSIYLVHWPLIVFYKMWKLDALDSWEKVLLFALSVILGFLMWKFVEQKFRYKHQESKLLPFKLVIPLLSLLVLIGSYYFLNQEMEITEEEGVQKVLTEKKIESEMERYWQDAVPDSQLLNGSDDSEVIVMGNSHAVDLIYAFKRNGLKSKIHSFPTTHLCYHFGFEAVNSKDEKKCKELSVKHMNKKSWKSADAVFLHDHWPVENLKSLKKTLLELRRKTSAPIYVFGPKMVFKSTIPQLVKASGSEDAGVINEFAVRYSDLKERSFYDQKIVELFEMSKFNSINIHYVSLLDEAGLKEIINSKTGEYFYFDKSHLTEFGAIELGKRIKMRYPELFSMFDKKK